MIMKLSYFRTHWSAAEAALVQEFLEDLAQMIAVTYAEDIERWHKEMTAECMRCQQARRTCNLNDDSDDAVPF
jgi:hypothetical protein